MAGDPPSPNGASSFHLWWEFPGRPILVAVEATLEIVEPPVVDRLYFWALQASFVDEMTGMIGGGGHFGLQYNPRHSGNTAVNWGGYASKGPELEGSDSALPGIPGDRNTRNYPWRPGRAYRLRVARSPDLGPDRLGAGPDAWRGSVTDLFTGETTVVRDLYARGRLLTSPLVWTESFARCDHPPVTVRWSDLAGETVDGSLVPPEAVRVSYQARRDGGCDNTTVMPTTEGFLQRTATARAVRDGAVLPNWGSD